MIRKKYSRTGLFKFTFTLSLFIFLLLSENAFSKKPVLTMVGDSSGIFKASKDGKMTFIFNSTKDTLTFVKEDDQKVPDGEKARYIVDQMPEYPGGERVMLDFLQTNLIYPSSSAKKGIQRTSIFRIVISKTGNVTDIIVVKGLDEACDAEAIRVLKMMPKWSPGKQNGEDVSVYFTIPIQFK